MRTLDLLLLTHKSCFGCILLCCETLIGLKMHESLRHPNCEIKPVRHLSVAIGAELTLLCQLLLGFPNFT
jgi:hypothetical protein